MQLQCKEAKDDASAMIFPTTDTLALQTQVTTRADTRFCGVVLFSPRHPTELHVKVSIHPAVFPSMMHATVPTPKRVEMRIARLTVAACQGIFLLFGRVPVQLRVYSVSVFFR